MTLYGKITWSIMSSLLLIVVTFPSLHENCNTVFGINIAIILLWAILAVDFFTFFSYYD